MDCEYLDSNAMIEGDLTLKAADRFTAIVNSLARAPNERRRAVQFAISGYQSLIRFSVKLRRPKYVFACSCINFVFSVTLQLHLRMNEKVSNG